MSLKEAVYVHNCGLDMFEQGADPTLVQTSCRLRNFETSKMVLDSNLREGKYGGQLARAQPRRGMQTLVDIKRHS